MLDESRVSASSTNQESELDGVLDKFLLALTLPETFMEFRDLDQVRKEVLLQTGIDGTSQKCYRPRACQKRLLTRAKDILLSLNTDSYLSRAVSMLKRKLLERGIEKQDAVKISYQMVNIISHENLAKEGLARIEHLAEERGMKLNDIQENPDKGANLSFTAIFNGRRYYIKTCFQDTVLDTVGEIDPNELLVYKVMEYLGFGPKTVFLFGSYSNARISLGSPSRSNFIMTEDLNQDGNRLLLDTEENFEDIRHALATDKQFAVEVSAAIVLNDILCLADTFGSNVKNYGMLLKSDGSKKMQFIDHLPNEYDGLFSEMDFDHRVSYSPRDELQRRTRSNPICIQDPSAFSDLENNRSAFPRASIQRDVDERLSGLGDAVSRAEADVRVMIAVETYGDNFADDADEKLTRYLENIVRNKTIYENLIPQIVQEERNVVRHVSWRKFLKFFGSL